VWQIVQCAKAMQEERKRRRGADKVRPHALDKSAMPRPPEALPWEATRCRSLGHTHCGGHTFLRTHKAGPSRRCPAFDRLCRVVSCGVQERAAIWGKDMSEQDIRDEIRRFDPHVKHVPPLAIYRVHTVSRPHMVDCRLMRQSLYAAPSRPVGIRGCRRLYHDHLLPRGSLEGQGAGIRPAAPPSRYCGSVVEGS
jgi:hypothetical protein